MENEVLVDNKDIKIEQVKVGGTVITTSKSPKKPISEWTPEYEKRCDHWKQVAKKIADKKN